ncbi:DUF29 domain-containing protein [Aphanothece sacrum]|uniref:DUF29 domain-containing protein n=1 Tax=Aphanothece sacrum FPU1 TaxID=1920663 RepID=A0A401IIZ1_APHSA|nr:DUF29 domain-containing protein [Aphanothece sacrum]GBF81071.1 hypothetical protein AsFPU1_2480 [Aphanothece sacrum FPU1]GBF85472.1 hypothetical protein AsFPU3_2531 [Aphanothece sacrum FPU3]
MSTKLYEKDFNLWIEQTIEQLANQEFESLDIANLIEELRDLGKAEKNALESNLMILLAHLLKLNIQADAPETMKNSWYNSVIEHRKRIKKQLSKTPSLKAYLPTILQEAYTDGRDIAIKEGKRTSFGIRMPNESEYPSQCPFTFQQILDDDFYGEY